MTLFRRLAMLALAAVAVAGCSREKADDRIVLGFSQIGAESEWRTANTESIKSAAITSNIDLRFADAQQKQENQIKALRSFIAQKVDVIAFSPVVATGWDNVLHGSPRRRHSRDPHRSRRDQRSIAVRRFPRFGLRRRRSKGSPLGHGEIQGHPGRREHRRTAGHRGCRARQRSQEGVRGNHRRRSALAGSFARRRETSRAPRARRRWKPS